MAVDKQRDTFFTTLPAVRRSRVECPLVWLALTCLLSLGVAVGPRWVEAQPATLDPRDPIDAALSCYAQIDYDCVLEALADFSVEEAVEAYPRGMVEAGVRVLAVTYVVRGVPERSRQLFFELLMVFPEYELVGEELSPRFFVVFEQARAMSIAARSAEGVRLASRLVSGTNEVSRRGGEIAQHVRSSADRMLAIGGPGDAAEVDRGVLLRFGLGLGFQVLVGPDGEAFDDSFGLSFRVSTDQFFGLAIELAFDRHLHEVRLPDLIVPNSPPLEVIDIAMGIGYPFQLKRARVFLGAGAGYSAFGYDGRFERGALLVDVVAGASVALPSGLGVGVEVRPRFVATTAADAVAVSNPISFGVHVLYELGR